MRRPRNKFANAILVLICLPALAAAQTNAEQRHRQFIELLKKTANDISDRALIDVTTLDDWESVRPTLRQEFLYTMGLDPLPERTALNVEITGTLSRPRYRIEKIVFQSMPGLYVTGNLYVPHEPLDHQISPSQPFPTILYVCGHSPHPSGAKWNYQDRAVWFAEHGYVCFVIDTLEFGEVAGIHHGLHNLNTWHWLSRGYTPAGVEVWNAMRAIDYLESREEVDAGRIGITGISGGGAISWYAAAADERIAVSVPVCGTFTFGSQAKHWRASGQCDCIYYHNTYLTDLSIVAALIAPRPLLICSGQFDVDFPPDGYHEVFHRGKRIYDLYSGFDSKVSRIKEVDLIRTIDWLDKDGMLSPAPLSVYGKGQMGVVSLYAAIIDERIDQVIVRDPIATHRHGAALLNVLRITDIPEAAAVLAPRQLVFLGDEIPHPFQLTTAIYQLQGDAQQIRRSGSLPEALEVWKH